MAQLNFRGRDPSYAFLLTLLLIFTALFSSLMKFYQKFSQNNGLNTSLDPFREYSTVFLFTVVLFILGYILILVSYILLRFFYHGRTSQKSKLITRIKGLLKKAIFHGVLPLIFMILMMAANLAIIHSFLVYPMPYSGMIDLFLLAVFFSFLLYVMLREEIKNKKTKKYLRTALVILAILAAPLLIHTLINATYYYTSSFEVIPDKGHYSVEEDVRIKIFPRGNNKPLVREIFYSNKEILLINMTDEEFRASPTYITINSSDLVLESHNSFLKINYDFGKRFFTWFNLPHASQITPIPVFPSE